MHDADAFTMERLEIRGVEIEFVREGEGYPLLLLHGWPDTKRIWWRNIGPLAEAGFCVIAPDLRGNGGSGLAPDDVYDTAASARDLAALLGQLGHERCGVVGGDWGGVVAYDLSLRFPGLVERLVLFNTVPPRLPGGSREIPPEVMQAADYFIRQGTDAAGLCEELSTPELRRRYVAQMYGPRFWSAPGSFSAEDVAFMTEPFGDAERFRASLAPYEYALRARAWSEPPLLDRENPTPALILYGPEDHVIPRDFPERMAEALPDRMGPFVVPGAGHWLQWEAADLLNGAVRHFHLDLLRTSGA